MGQTLRRLAKRFATHDLSIEQFWKTQALPTDALIEAEARVLAYARSLAGPARLFYSRGRGSSEDTEMFHGAGFGAVRAYADVIARCEAVADECSLAGATSRASSRACTRKQR